MKNYLKTSINTAVYSIFLMMLSMTFTSCEKENYEPTSVEGELLQEETNIMSKNDIWDPWAEKTVAFRNVYNGRYVCSENGKDMTCNRTWIKSWETFKMQMVGDEGVYIIKGNNGKLLSAKNGVRCDGGGSGWEEVEFELRFTSENTTAIRPAYDHDALYLFPDGDKLSFGMDYLRDDTIFEIIYLD